MPGRTPVGAFDAFVDPLRIALACVATCKLTTTAGGRHDVDVVHHLLSNRGGTIDVGGPHRLQLRIRMKYQIVKKDDLDDGPYKISTIAYSHTVTDRAGMGVVDFHWHPDAQSHVKQPHLHIGATQLSNDAILSNKNHLSTGRVSLETVIRQLITDHGVEPRCDDWYEKLALSDGVFQLYRSWG